jgi:hypothetical protein
MSVGQWPPRPERPDSVPVRWGLDSDALTLPTDLRVGDRLAVTGDGEWIVAAVDPVRLERA